MDQYLVDYTVRNITTGDEEDIRVLELEEREYDGFPDKVREELRSIIKPVAWLFRAGQSIQPRWDDAQDRILTLLTPYISDSWTYGHDYTLWEQRLLDTGHAVERITEANPPEHVAAAVRAVLTEGMEAAIENWAEGHWEDWHADITHAEVVDRFIGFLQAWTEDADYPPFTDRILPAEEVEA